jgi:NADH-quinone oxidoreductase subunit H
VRWTLPRLRIDQVMMTCLKYLLPISCVLLLGVSLWQLAVPAVLLVNLRFVMALVCVVLVGVVAWRMGTTFKVPPSGGMPGAWNLTGPPRYEAAGRG